MSKFFRTLKRSLKSLKTTEYARNTRKRDWKYARFELWSNFLDTFFYSWFNPIKVFYESCKRVIGWLPIIWKDRDWIDNNIFMILQYRLKRARESMIKYSYYANSEEYGRQMRVAELLCERLQDSTKYTEFEWDEHYKKWPQRFGRCIENEDGSITLAPPIPGESEDAKRIFNKEEYMWLQDFDYLTKYMRKHVRKWGH